MCICNCTKLPPGKTAVQLSWVCLKLEEGQSPCLCNTSTQCGKRHLALAPGSLQRGLFLTQMWSVPSSSPLSLTIQGRPVSTQVYSSLRHLALLEATDAASSTRLAEIPKQEENKTHSAGVRFKRHSGSFRSLFWSLTCDYHKMIGFGRRSGVEHASRLTSKRC